MTKYILFAALAVTTANLCAEPIAKSYVKLQRERIAKADAAYYRFQQDQAAKAEADKVAAEALARQKEADKAYRRQLAIAAASATRINVNQQVWW